MNIVVEHIFQNKPELKISKKELRQLFELATSGTHFLFNSNFYDQIDGVSMGSPLGPVLANLFMGCHETKWLDEFQKSEVLLYRRYVDDIFCMFKKEKDANEFFSFLNTQHPNIKFTIEKELNHSLPFLDILIKNESNKFITSVYRKKTSIGLFTQYDSFTPFTYKTGLIKCLIHRAFKISSSYIIFHDELNKIKLLLQKNLYPLHVIDQQIKKFLDKQYTKDSTPDKKNRTVFFKLPYIGQFSNSTKVKLKEICKRFCKETDIVIALTPLKIGKFFSCKDKIPKSLQSYVVYQFTCAGCKACYIGETKRHLTTRIEEHLGKDKKSHIFKHLQENPQCQSKVNLDCFEIIDHASSYFRLQVKEAMHITWKKPVLNKQVKHVSITLSI